MTKAMMHSGITRTLWRERQPFALLALLLVLLPMLMAPAFAGGAPSAFEICSSGASQQPLPETEAPHQPLTCCGVVCAHGCALAGPAGEGRSFGRVALALSHDFPRATVPPAASPVRSGPIRAPPAAVA